MSKPVKTIMMRDYRELLGDHEDALVISIRGIDSEDTSAIRTRLRDKDIRVTVVRNALFRQTFTDSGLAPLGEVLKGGSALAYGAESVVDVAREIVALMKDFPDLELKGAVLDGKLFKGRAGVEALSKYPTRDEAIAKAVAIVIGPGSKLVAALKGPGSGIAGIVKAIEDKLEKGEAITKVG